MKFAALLGAVALAFACAASASAAIVDQQANGFLIEHKVVINAPAEKVWRTLINIGSWWSADHTYSRDAANLNMSTLVGGCWCETLPGKGELRHMVVTFIAENEALRLEGGLGPLGGLGVAGHMTFELAEANGKTTVTWTYEVGGYTRGGLQQWAGPVDNVMAQQFARLKAAAEKAD